MQGISFDPENRPGVANLLTILAACQTNGRQSSPLELAQQYASRNHSDLKTDVADAVEARIRPIREEYLRLKADEGWLRQVAGEGVMRARNLASKTMAAVKKQIGLD